MLLLSAPILPFHIVRFVHVTLLTFVLYYVQRKQKKVLLAEIDRLGRQERKVFDLKSFHLGRIHTHSDVYLRRHSEM